MQASMSEVVLPLDGRDDEVRHSTEMDQIGSSCRDESQISSQIDDETLEDAEILIDHTLVQYFGITLPSVAQNEHQPSPPPVSPRVERVDAPAEQELSKTSEPKSFSVESVEPSLVAIDQYVSTIDPAWDETLTDFNYYLPNYAQEVVITTETNSPHAPDKEPSERLVTAPNGYSLDNIVPEKSGVQGFRFEEALNPPRSTQNPPNPPREEAAFFDDMDLNPAGLKNCKSFYEAQTNELNAEGSPENVSPGCSSMHIVPMSDGMLEVGTQSPPEELVGSVALDVGKNVIVEMNPVASPDVARVPCSNPVCQPMSPPPSYRQTMAAAYQKTVYDPLSCCGPYGNVVKNKIVMSYSGEGIMSENDSRDSDYGPPKLDAIDDSHTLRNDQPNDHPPMLEPADPAFSSTGKVAIRLIPSAAGEALESTKKLSLGVVPENGQEFLEGSSQDELNECLGKLVPSITPEFSKEIPSGYIVNDMYNIRNITPESSTIATCVDDVGSLPDLLPVTEEPKSYRTFCRTNAKKKKSESTENFGSSSSQTKSVEKLEVECVNRLIPEPPSKFENSCNLHENSTKRSVQNLSNAQSSSENPVNVVKKDPSAFSAPIEKIGPITRVLKVSKNIPQQALNALMHDDGTGRANFKIIPTTATTINLGVKKFTIVKPQSMKDKIVLLKPATVTKILASDLESVSNLKQLSSVQSCNLEKMLLSQASLDPKCIVKPTDLKNLPTSSQLPSNSVILKLSKDNSNPSTVRGMSKVAVSKSSVALKVSLPLESLPLDLLPVKLSLPDAVKKDSCNKDDEPIEKAVTADGDVDPNAIMDAMKVSVPYLFPVTKPEVKKIVKPDVVKVEKPPNLVQVKKKSAAPPVVVKLTSKANRKMFSPLRDVDVSLDKSESVNPKKPDNSLARKTDTPSTKPEANVPSTDKASDTIKTKGGDVVKTEQAKEKTVQSISNDSRKKLLEPSLMKQVDNASDDLSSFLSSLSGPEDLPKGVENLEKVVHGTIIAASPCVVDVSSVAPTKTKPANDPVIIPPSAFRTDDPLSLKVGLKPCSFRNLRKGELSKKPLIFQSVRSAPTSSRSTALTNSKQIGVLQCEPSIGEKSIILRTTTSLPSTLENHIVPVEESTFENKEESQIETEEKVHPIVELINQLIESNSKSPQVFSEPDKTRSEDCQVPKKGDEAIAVQKKVETQNAFPTFKNDENRAKEDGILVGVVKERTSKLIQKARDLVPDDHVPCSDDNASSLAVDKSVKPSNEGVLEKTTIQKHSNNNSTSTAETSVDSKATKSSAIRKNDLLQKASITDKVLERPKEAAVPDKTLISLPTKETDSPVISNVATDGVKDRKQREGKPSPTIVLPEKNSSSENALMVQASTPSDAPSNQKNLTIVSVSVGSVPEESKGEKTKDLNCPPKTADSSETCPPLAIKPLEQQKQAISEQTTVTSRLQTNHVAVTKIKTVESLKRNKPLTQTKVSILKEPRTDEPQSTTYIPVSAVKNFVELEEKIERDDTHTATDVPVVSIQGLKVDKAKDCEAYSKTTDLCKKTPSSTDRSNRQPSEMLAEEPITSQLQATGTDVSACKISKDSKAKKAKDNKDSLDTNDTSKKVPPSTANLSSKPKLLPAIEADRNQSTMKTSSCGSTEETSKEFKGKQQVNMRDSLKSAGSSKKAVSSTEKLPTQLIVSIPTVAISNQPHTSDLLVSVVGTLDELKVEKVKSAKSFLRTIDTSKKAPSSKDEPLKQTKVPVPDANSKSETIGVPVSASGTSEESTGEKTPVKDSSSNVSEKVPLIKDALLKQEQIGPALDRRTSMRRKSRSEVPISTSDELKGEEVKDTKGPSERGGSLRKDTPFVDKPTDKLNGSDVVKRGNLPTLQPDTSSPLSLLTNAKGEANGSQAESIVLPENPSLEKPAKTQKIPEKISQRMRTRGIAPASASSMKEVVKVEGPKETEKITETVVSAGNDSPIADELLQPKIPSNDKSSNRPRTRSETSSDRKMIDEGATENLKHVPPVADDDDEHGLLNEKRSVKKSRIENIEACPVSSSTTALVPSLSPKVTERKQEVNNMPTHSQRTRGKIERKPATVKPIPATPKKGCSKFLGNSKVLEPSLVDNLCEPNDSPSPPNKILESRESANTVENGSEIEGGNDDKTGLRTPISTRRTSSLKNKVLGRTETTGNGNSDTGKPVSLIRKFNSHRATLSSDPKKQIPKKNLRVSMKPKKVSKLINKEVKNDVYDFTDDEDQSTKIQTIDHYRKVSGKSTKNKKNSFSRFETSQESLLLSDDENKSNNQARIGRNETKVIRGKTKRRASPRKSMSEPRKLESKKGAESQFINVTSESTESLLSNTNETVLPAELQENLRNSRNESIRMAKQNRLKSPIRKLSSADTEESRSPKPSSTRETRRSSGSRTSSIENVNMADQKDKKELENEKDEVKSTIETLTRETRRSSGSSSTSGEKLIADQKDFGKKEIVKVGSSDKTRKRSPMKKDLNNVSDKLSHEKMSEDCNIVKSKEFDVNSINEVSSKPNGDRVSPISTRSKSRDSVNEDDTLLPRVLRNKGTLQHNPIVASESPKPVKEKPVTKSSEEVNKVQHKIDKNDHDKQVSSNLESSDHELDTIQSLSTEEACSTIIDQASSSRMSTRSSGIPSLKTTENGATENPGSKAGSISDEGAFLPKLRSSVNKRLDVFNKAENEVSEVQCAPKSNLHTNEKLSEVLPTNMESINRLSQGKLKKIKKTDSAIFAGNKEGRFPVENILVDVSKPITIATGDSAEKEKPKRVKKGGVAEGVNDMLLSKLPLLSTQEVASRNAEAVSLKTPLMDSTVSHELDNIQPVGDMAQHGEPEGAKSSTRVALLRSLVVPLDEDGCSASNSIGFLRKKNKNLVVEKKKLAQSRATSDAKPIDEEVITRKSNDAIIKSGNKLSSVNCLDPPVKFERNKTHVDNEVVSTPSFSLSESPPCESKTDETSNPNRESTRRITRASLSTSSPNSELKSLRSTSKGEQEDVSLKHYMNSSFPDLSQIETEPCSSKNKNALSKERLKLIYSQNSPSDPVKENLSTSDLETSNDSGEHTPQIHVETHSLKTTFGSRKVEVPRNEHEAAKTFRSRRGRNPKAVLTATQPLRKNEMKFAQPKPLDSEREKGALAKIVSPGLPSGEYLRSLRRNTTEGKSKTSTKKDVLTNPSSYSIIPTVGRVKTTTKDVCEISGEAEKLFEEASLDGKEGFDVIVPSPGKSPDSTTQNSSEMIIPALSSELDDLADAKLSEDAHGVTSTTELGNIFSDTERKMLILPHDFVVNKSPTKKEDESVSSTTVDSTKILETNEIESSSDHLVSLIGDSVIPKSVTVDNENCRSNLKTVAEHPKKIWRVNPVLNGSSAPIETTAKMMVGSLENEVSNVVKTISDEELKRTPLKKRQVWAYSKSCNSKDVKKLVCAGSSPVEGDPPVMHSTNDASPSSECLKSSPAVIGSSNVSPEIEVTTKSSEVIFTGKADGTCSPTSIVDRLPHSICNILAAPADKMITNEPTIEPPSGETESSDRELHKPNKGKVGAHNTRSKSKGANMVKRKANIKSRAIMTLRSSKNRVTQKRHLVTRNRQVKIIKKRYNIVRKSGANYKKLQLSPLPKLLPSQDVNQGRSYVGQMNQGKISNEIREITNEAHSFQTNKLVNISNTNSGPSKNPAVQHTHTDTDIPVVAPSESELTKVLETVKQPVKVSSPSSKNKYAELIVDTTGKEIEDEESPPFSPIGVDTTKHSDWNSHSSGAHVESSAPVQRSPPAPLPSCFTRGIHGTPPGVPPENVTYRRSHKIERMRSYSNDEPDRSYSHSSKARSRRNSHPVENVPVDLSNHVKPVFGMKIPPNLPKLDLTGRTPIYHEALEQPPGPYDLIPTTIVRPIPTPPPNYVPPHPLVVHSIKGNGPIRRPFPTLRVASPVAPYGPITSQFTRADEMSIELSSRMNAKYSMSAFHSTKKPSNPNFTEPKKVDYNPLLFAHGNNYILNAGVANVIPSLPSASTHMTSSSSLMKPNKSRSGRGRNHSTASNVTTSASMCGIRNVKYTLLDSTRSTSRDARLREAQVQLLVSNPELSISRTAASGIVHPLTTGNSYGSSEVRDLGMKQSKTLAFNSSGSSNLSLSNNSFRGNRRVIVEQIIEPLDVVTCELYEGSPDTLAHITRINASDITKQPSTTLEQQTPKKVLAPKDIRNEPKNTRVSTKPAQRNIELVQEAIVVEHVASTKNLYEKLPAKGAVTPRRRMSILDAHKSYKNNSPTAVVTTQSPTEVLSVRDTDINSTPPSISFQPKVPDSKTTKTIEKNNVVLPTDSKGTKTSDKTITIPTTESKRLASPSQGISPCCNLATTSFERSSHDAEPKLDHVEQRASASFVNPNRKITARRPNFTKEGKDPLTVVDGPGISLGSNAITDRSDETLCEKDKVIKSLAPRHALPTEPELNNEKIGETLLTSNEPNTSFKIEGTVNTTQSSEKVEPRSAKQGNSRPVNAITNEVVTCNQSASSTESKTDKFTNSQSETKTVKVMEPGSEPITEVKRNEANIEQRIIVVEKSISKLKTEASLICVQTKLKPEVVSNSTTPTADGKLNEANVEPKAVVVGKSIPKQQTEGSSTHAQTKLKTEEVSKSTSYPVTDGKLNEANVEPKPEVVGRSIPKQQTAASLTQTAQIKLKPDEVPKCSPKPITDSKLNEVNVEPNAEVVRKFTPKLKPEASLTPARAELKTGEVTKSSSKPITDGKLNEANLESNAEVVRKSTPKLKPEASVIPARAELKTDEVPKCSPKPIADGKLNEANVERNAEVVGKSTPKLKTEASLTPARAELQTGEVTKSSSKPITDGKLNEANVEPKAEVVGRSIPKQQTAASSTQTAQIKLKPDEVPKCSPKPITDSKLNEVNVEPNAEVVGKSTPELKPEASLTPARAELKTGEVTKSSSKPITDGKLNEANLESNAEVVGKSTPTLKPEASVIPARAELKTDEVPKCSPKPIADGKLNEVNVEQNAEVVGKSTPKLKPEASLTPARAQLQTGEVTKSSSKPITDGKLNEANVEPKAEVVGKSTPKLKPEASLTPARAQLQTGEVTKSSSKPITDGKLNEANLESNAEVVGKSTPTLKPEASVIPARAELKTDEVPKCSPKPIADGKLNEVNVEQNAEVVGKSTPKLKPEASLTPARAQLQTGEVTKSSSKPITDGKLNEANVEPKAEVVGRSIPKQKTEASLTQHAQIKLKPDEVPNCSPKPITDGKLGEANVEPNAEVVGKSTPKLKPEASLTPARAELKTGEVTKSSSKPITDGKLNEANVEPNAEVVGKSTPKLKPEASLTPARAELKTDEVTKSSSKPITDGKLNEVDVKPKAEVVGKSIPKQKTEGSLAHDQTKLKPDEVTKYTSKPIADISLNEAHGEPKAGVVAKSIPKLKAEASLMPGRKELKTDEVTKSGSKPIVDGKLYEANVEPNVEVVEKSSPKQKPEASLTPARVELKTGEVTKSSSKPITDGKTKEANIEPKPEVVGKSIAILKPEASLSHVQRKLKSDEGTKCSSKPITDGKLNEAYVEPRVEAVGKAIPKLKPEASLTPARTELKTDKVKKPSSKAIPDGKLNEANFDPKAEVLKKSILKHKTEACLTQAQAKLKPDEVSKSSSKPISDGNLNDANLEPKAEVVGKSVLKQKTETSLRHAETTLNAGTVAKSKSKTVGKLNEANVEPRAEVVGKTIPIQKTDTSSTHAPIKLKTEEVSKSSSKPITDGKLNEADVEPGAEVVGKSIPIQKTEASWTPAQTKLKADQVSKCSSKPITDSKLNEAPLSHTHTKLKADTSLAVAHAKRKTDEYSSKPITEGKPNKANVELKAVAFGKSIPKPITDASVPLVHTKLINDEPSTSCSNPISGKLPEANIEIRAEVVEKSIPIPIINTLKITHDHTKLKTDKIAKCSSKPTADDEMNKTNILPAIVVEESIPKPKTDAQLNKINVELMAKVIEKPISQLKKEHKPNTSDIEPNAKVVTDDIFNAANIHTDENGDAITNIHTEPTKAVTHPKTNDYHNREIYTISSDVVSEARNDNEKSNSNSVAPNLFSEVVTKANPTTIDKLGKGGVVLHTDKTVTKASCEKADEKLETVLNEQEAVDQLKTSTCNSGYMITSSFTDKPISGCPSKLVEEPTTAEKTSPETVTTDSRIEVSDTSTKFESNGKIPLKDRPYLKSPPSHDENSKNSTGKPKPLCPLSPTGLPSASVDGKDATDYLTNKVVNSPIEVEKHTLLEGSKNVATFSPPVLRYPPQGSSQVESVLNMAHYVIETSHDSSMGKEETKPAEVDKVNRFEDYANPKKLFAPGVRIVVEHNNPPAADPANQTKEDRETICSAVELIGKNKVEDELITNTTPSLSLEERTERKNVTICSSAAGHVELENEDKRVCNLVTAQEKTGGKLSSNSVDAKSLERLVVTVKPVIDSKMVKCIKKKGENTSGNDFVTDVVPSSEITKSVCSSLLSDGEHVKSQDSEVTNCLSKKPLPTEKSDGVSVLVTHLCKEVAREDRVTPSSSSVDVLKLQEDSSTVDDKLDHGTGKVKSNLKNDDENGSSIAPEISTEHPSSVVPPNDNRNSTVKPDPSPAQSLNPSNVGPNSSNNDSVDETTPKVSVNIASTQPDNCKVEQVAGTPSKWLVLPIKDVSSSVSLSNTDPAVSNQREESSSTSDLKVSSMEENPSNYSNKEPDHLKPNQAVACTDPSTSRATENTKECDNAEIQESSLRTLVFNTVQAVPNFTPETCAVVQSTDNSHSLPSDPTKDLNLKGSISQCESRVTGVLITRPERKRKRPAWLSLEDGTVASKLHKSNTPTSSASPFEVECRGEYDEKIQIDPTVPKVEVELLCQSVIRKLKESLGISIDHVDLNKLTKYWAEFHSSFSRDSIVKKEQFERSNLPNESCKKLPAERLSASEIHARPSTSRSSDYRATIHSPASRSWMEKEANAKSGDLGAILHERHKLAKTSQLESPIKRGEKRTVSQAFAQNVYIYKDPRVTGRSTYERRQLLPYEIPEVANKPPIRQPQISYSWILEHLRERRKKNQLRESNIPAQPCKDFIRLHEEYTRPSLKEVYTSYAEGHPASVVGYSRVSTVHEVPLPASTSSSTASKIPTFTISSDSEDSNPGNPEVTVNERDEVRRRIRRKSNTPSISSCSCPQSGHGSNRTTCSSCRKERYYATGSFSPIRSSHPSLYKEISHVERQESAKIRGKHAATVGGGGDPVTVPDSEAAVHILKRMLATTWQGDLDTLNDDPPVTRDSFTSYQEDVSPPHVTVSPYPPPLLISSSHPPPDMERVAGANFQRCLQQKPLSERGRPEDNNDNVQHDPVISTGRQVFSFLSQSGTPTGQLRAAFPAMMDNMRAAGSGHERHSGVGAGHSVTSHGQDCRPSSSANTDDRGPPKRNPSQATKRLLVKFRDVLEDLTPEVCDEIAELSRHTTDTSDELPTKKKKS